MSNRRLLNGENYNLYLWWNDGRPGRHSIIQQNSLLRRNGHGWELLVTFSKCRLESVIWWQLYHDIFWEVFVIFLTNVRRSGQLLAAESTAGRKNKSCCVILSSSTKYPSIICVVFGISFLSDTEQDWGVIFSNLEATVLDATVFSSFQATVDLDLDIHLIAYYNSRISYYVLKYECDHWITSDWLQEDNDRVLTPPVAGSGRCIADLVEVSCELRCASLRCRGTPLNV